MNNPLLLARRFDYGEHWPESKALQTHCDGIGTRAQLNLVACCHCG